MKFSDQCIELEQLIPRLRELKPFWIFLRKIVNNIGNIEYQFSHQEESYLWSIWVNQSLEMIGFVYKIETNDGYLEVCESFLHKYQNLNDMIMKMDLEIKQFLVKQEEKYERLRINKARYSKEYRARKKMSRIVMAKA